MNPSQQNLSRPMNESSDLKRQICDVQGRLLKRKDELPDDVPKIPLEYGRNKFGVVVGLRVTEFKPGMIITRCGKKYRVDAKGQQRRIRDAG